MSVKTRKKRVTADPVQHPPMDLIGTQAAAELIGVAVSNLKPYDPETKVGIKGLPEPVAQVPHRVWYGPNIRAFAKEYRKHRARRAA